VTGLSVMVIVITVEELMGADAKHVQNRKLAALKVVNVRNSVDLQIQISRIKQYKKASKTIYRASCHLSDGREGCNQIGTRVRQGRRHPKVLLKSYVNVSAHAGMVEAARTMVKINTSIFAIKFYRNWPALNSLACGLSGPFHNPKLSFTAIAISCSDPR